MLWHRPVLCLALGFGAGLSPRAPGTVGTAVGVVVYLPLSQLPIAPYVAVVTMLAIAGVWICGRATRFLGVEDSPAIVWDEIVGYLVAMISAPTGWIWPLAGFVVFRIFDIAKPWPVGWADRRLGGGLGIMLDDVLAGLYTLALIQLLAALAGAR